MNRKNPYLIYVTAYGEEAFYGMAVEFFRMIRFFHVPADLLLICTESLDAYPALAETSKDLDIAVEVLPKAYYYDDIVCRSMRLQLFEQKAIRNIHSYQRIAYFDTDIFFYTSPLALFEKSLKSDAVIFTSHDRGDQRTHLFFLSHYVGHPEYEEFQKRFVNSGFFIGPPLKLKILLKIWRNEYLKRIDVIREMWSLYKKTGRFEYAICKDQNVLHYLLCTKKARIDFFPSDLIVFRDRFRSDSSVGCHLCALNKDPGSMLQEIRLRFMLAQKIITKESFDAKISMLTHVIDK